MMALASGFRSLRTSSMVKLLLSGSGWALISQALSKIVVLLTSLVGARLLGVENFGTFVSLQAVMLLSLSAWDLGLSPLIIRDVAAGQWPLENAVVTGIRFRFMLFPVWLITFATGSFLIGISNSSVLVCCILLGLSGIAMGGTALLDACLRGEMNFRTSATALSSGRVSAAAVVVALFVVNPPNAITFMALASLVGELVTVSLQIKAFRQRGLDLRAAMPFQFVSTARKAVPYAMNGFFTIVYNRADVVIVTLLAGATQSGLYAPASRFQDAMMLLPTVAIAGLIQVAAKAHHGGRHDEVGQALVLSLLVSFGLSLLATVCVYLLLPWLVPYVLGNEYVSSVTPLRILIWAVPIAALEAPIISILIAKGYARLSTIIYAGALTTSVIGLFILTPTYGAKGAAWASFLREPVALTLAISVLLVTSRPNTTPLKG